MRRCGFPQQRHLRTVALMRRLSATVTARRGECRFELKEARLRQAVEDRALRGPWGRASNVRCAVQNAVHVVFEEAQTIVIEGADPARESDVDFEQPRTTGAVFAPFQLQHGWRC